MRGESFDTFCSFDPGVDKSRADREAFAKHMNERDNIDQLRHAFTAEGPTLYRIREIPRDVWWSFVVRADTESEKHKRAFMAGVERVQNLYQRNGTRIAEWCGSDAQTFEGKTFDMMKLQDLRMFSPLEVEEIGAVAFAHSFFPPRIASCFALPPTSHRMLVEAAADFRPVESSPISQESPSGAP